MVRFICSFYFLKKFRVIEKRLDDEGAQSSTGTTEAETNLKIALKVQNLLEQSGAQQ